jgi:hypothetical protein
MAFSLAVDKSNGRLGETLVARIQALANDPARRLREAQRRERDRAALRPSDAKDLGYPTAIIDYGDIGALSTAAKCGYVAFCALVGALGIALLLQIA